MIRVLSLAVVIALGATQPLQAKPFDPDPFKDADFAEKPILQKKAHKTQRRLELSAMFSISMVEKYMRHIGPIATAEMHLLDQLSLQLYGGYFGSKYTAIVTSSSGILDSHGTAVDANVPDRLFMTYIVDAVVIFSPLYGKLNLVSEGSFNFDLYILAGAGINGTRTLTPTSTDITQGFNLRSDTRGAAFNFQWGFGFKFFLTRWMTLRIEYRDIDYIDTFHDTSTRGDQFTYLIMNHMFHVGIGFLPF